MRLETSSNYGFGICGNLVNGNSGEGKVDALGIWTRAITDQEITTLYNNGNGVEL